MPQLRPRINATCLPLAPSPEEHRLFYISREDIAIATVSSLWLGAGGTIECFGAAEHRRKARRARDERRQVVDVDHVRQQAAAGHQVPTLIEVRGAGRCIEPPPRGHEAC